MAKYIVHNGIRIASEFVPETFGRLTTIGPVFLLSRHNQINRRDAWQVCECVCGTVRVFTVTNLGKGSTSCGCFQAEQSRKTHKKHGDVKTVEYRTWMGLRSRCNPSHPRYVDYSGRGIRVCDRWLDSVNGYVNFLADMGRKPSPKHSLDRINNDGNYEASNCRWATNTEQSRNRRSSRNISGFGQIKCLSEWAEEYSICSATLRDRIDAGMTIEEAVKHPTKKHYPKKKQ